MERTGQQRLVGAWLHACTQVRGFELMEPWGAHDYASPTKQLPGLNRDMLCPRT